MAHCGYEPTAANMTIANPFKAMKIALFGVKTEGEMAPEISLANQRPAQYVFEQQVHKTVTQLNAEKAQKAADNKAAMLAAREPCITSRQRNSATVIPAERLKRVHARLQRAMAREPGSTERKLKIQRS